MRITWRNLCATMFGLGLSPVMPGTVGSLGIIPFFFLYQTHFFIYSVVFLIILLGSVPLCGSVAKTWKQKDPQVIVLDEVLGLMLALFFAKPLWRDCLALFVLFRIFDISKIWPLSYLEKLEGGWGIVLDDLVAGLFAGLVWILIGRIL